MSVVDDLIAPTTEEGWKDRILALMDSVALAITAWVVGMPSEQWLSIMAALFQVQAVTVTAANRAQFLDEATDPGDDDGLAPAPGWLSKKGAGDYGTDRIDNTFATGFVTLTNSGATTHVIRPEQVTIQKSATAKNYRNSDDDTLYPAPSKTLTLAPSTSAIIPVRAEEKGTDSNAAPGEIDTLVTSLLGVTVTNASPVLGTDRETRTKYVRRCKLAASATSPNGPADAYSYLIERTNTDGTISAEGDGKSIVNVTRINVTRDNTYGIVNVYLASPSGPATGDDVTAVETALDNNYAPDCVTRIVSAAAGVTVPVTCTVYVNAVAGLTSATIQAAVLSALTSFFAGTEDGDIEIGGYDGELPVLRIRSEVIQAHPRIYNLTMSAPLIDISLDPDDLPVLGAVTTTVVFT